jgi:hypothetical protein
MPLRDHFHAPLAEQRSWNSLRGQWPAMIVIDLNKRLSPRYVAEPRVYLGKSFEIDVAPFPRDDRAAVRTEQDDSQGGVATAVWAPPKPTFAVATEIPDQDEYEVRIVDTELGRLVAAIEIVSPGNKDRPDTRRAFVAKCATLLQQGVSVSIVDLVTSRQFNLYENLLEFLGQSDPALGAEPPTVYAVTCRWRREGRRGGLKAWVHSFAFGQALPTLPLWLDIDLAIPLDLELTYEETCRTLRIP